MNPLSCRTGWGWLPAVALAIVTSSARAERPIEYNRDVRPILAENCFSCHGFDAKHREADLRRDVPESATAKREAGRL